MAWYWFGFAFLIANAAALIFYYMLRLEHRARTIAWLACSSVIVLSPLWVPHESPPLRFLESVAAVCLLWKVYDAHRKPGLAIEMGVGKWLAYLPNWFWFVLKRKPREQARWRDWSRVAISTPLMVMAAALCVKLLRMDWSGIPFILEHSAKVLGMAVAMFFVGQTFSSLYRQLICPALDPFDNPFIARTPADFWRRWNQPFREFFDQYVFRPMGGARRPVRATLAVFAVSGLMHEYVFGVATGRVQGWQILFFMIHGVATVATLRVRPRGWAAPLWWAGTLLFNLTMAVLFCRSVDGVIDFYHR